MGFLIAVVVAWLLALGVVVYGIWQDERRRTRPVRLHRGEMLIHSGSVRRAP